MNHSAAKAIFDEIRARPYAVSTAPGVRAENCYFKGTELMERLGALGYTVRGCVGKSGWDPAFFPAEILTLASPDFEDTHFWCEALLDGEWVALDTSIDLPLAKHGFTATEFGDGRLCFAVSRKLTEAEQAAHMEMWSDPAYTAAYFKANSAFLEALNRYFEKLRA